FRTFFNQTTSSDLGKCGQLQVVKARAIPAPPVNRQKWAALDTYWTHGNYNWLRISQLEWWRRGEAKPRPESAPARRTTCLSHSICFADSAWNAQDAPPASPMNLAGQPRTEVNRPAYCVTPVTGPAGKARADELR